MAVSTIKKVRVNHKGFEATVEITSYTSANPYIAPTDGFARIILPYTRNNSITLYVDGQSVCSLANSSSYDTVGQQIVSFPVYAGQSVYIAKTGTGNNRAYFNAYSN